MQFAGVVPLPSCLVASLNLHLFGLILHLFLAQKLFGKAKKRKFPMEGRTRELCEGGSRDEDRDLIRDEVRYTVARFADEAGGPIRCVQCLSGC